jgi:ketosteroid isomerase-like protein
MPEIETRLRSYFDAAVERVTVEDVAARQRVFETSDHPRRSRQLRPIWAAAAAFVGTVAVLGGSLALGFTVRRPALHAGSGSFTETLSDVTETRPASWLFIAAIAVAVGLVGALIVKNHQRRTRKEKTMARTMEAPTIESPETAERTNRRLVWAVVGLAVALIVLGAWSLYSQAVEPETVPPAPVRELLDEYHAAWNNHDGDAFRELTTDDYMYATADGEFTQAQMARTIGGEAAARNFKVGIIGDATATAGAPYYVAVVNMAETTDAGGTTTKRNGVSTFVIVETDDGLKVTEHRFVGDD